MRVPKGARILHREKAGMVVELPPNPRRKYPLWDLDALQKDIDQAQASIESFHAAIAEREAMIAERTEQIALCRERDVKIAQWERDYGDGHV